MCQQHDVFLYIFTLLSPLFALPDLPIVWVLWRRCCLTLTANHSPIYVLAPSHREKSRTPGTMGYISINIIPSWKIMEALFYLFDSFWGCKNPKKKTCEPMLTDGIEIKLIPNWVLWVRGHPLVIKHCWKIHQKSMKIPWNIMESPILWMILGIAGNWL